MFRNRFLMSGSVAASLALAMTANAQITAPVRATVPHVIVVNLVERPGNQVPFAFEPATFTAERGDTLRFVQLANTMHNVHFKSQPKGAKLGGAASSPYLTTKGQTYNIVVDSRFADGIYELVCDPHETVGMHAHLTVNAAKGGIAVTDK